LELDELERQYEAAQQAAEDTQRRLRLQRRVVELLGAGQFPMAAGSGQIDAREEWRNEYYPTVVVLVNDEVVYEGTRQRNYPPFISTFRAGPWIESVMAAHRAWRAPAEERAIRARVTEVRAKLAALKPFG